jgi:hypothetical protein
MIWAFPRRGFAASGSAPCGLAPPALGRAPNAQCGSAPWSATRRGLDGAVTTAPAGAGATGKRALGPCPARGKGQGASDEGRAASAKGQPFPLPVARSGPAASRQYPGDPGASRLRGGGGRPGAPSKGRTWNPRRKKRSHAGPSTTIGSTHFASPSKPWSSQAHQRRSPCGPYGQPLTPETPRSGALCSATTPISCSTAWPSSATAWRAYVLREARQRPVSGSRGGERPTHWLPKTRGTMGPRSAEVVGLTAPQPGRRGEPGVVQTRSLSLWVARRHMGDDSPQAAAPLPQAVTQVGVQPG